MTTQSENETLTRVGPGSPAGELLRRYWHPVAAAGDLTDEKPIKAIKLLGEKLVVFRLPAVAQDSGPRYGLVAEQCRHRLASMAYGSVDDKGISCPYHGWKYDVSGQCIEQPAEPPESTYKTRIRQPAYPVQKLGGLLFAYLGPLPAPVLPRWDVLAREDGRRWIVIDSVIECNWLQPMENSVDPAHFYFLHGSLSKPEVLGPRRMAKYDEKHEFNRFEYGIMKLRVRPGKNPGDPPLRDEHPLIFPTTLRLDIDVRGSHEVRNVLQIRVPIDDTRTQHYSINFIPSTTVTSPQQVDPPHEYCALKNAAGEYNMDLVLAQDSMAWETQGEITDRTQEHLASSDRGIVMLRKLIREQIEIVQAGGEPMGVLRGPEYDRIIRFDTTQDQLGVKPSETVA
ncbi:MAG: Rieske 2Fe-2S domain-containing protein [Burkholderiales bacterium]